jgi:hypothetical protein
MTTGVPLVASLVARYVPGWLGPAFLFVGLELVIVGASRSGLSTWVRKQTLEMSDRERRVLYGGFGLGTFLCAVGGLRHFGLLQPYVVGLYVLGRAVEGIGAVHFYKRLLSWKSTPTNYTTLTTGALYHVGGFFVVLLGGWVLTLVAAPALAPERTGVNLLLLWTLVTAAVTALGLYWKFSVAAVRYPRGIVIGTILYITGAEIYNFSALTTDLFAVVLGGAGYAAGFWLAVYYWLRG